MRGLRHRSAIALVIALMALAGASGASAAGTITGSIGTMPEGVVYSDFAGSVSGSSDSASITPNASTGQFTVSIPAGSYTVYLYSSTKNVLQQRRSVTVVDGETVSLAPSNFTPGGRIVGSLTYPGASGASIQVNSSPWIQDGYGSSSGERLRSVVSRQGRTAFPSLPPPRQITRSPTTLSSRSPRAPLL